MMIRINLLPVRQVKKREAGRQFLVLMVGTLIIALLGNGYWYFTMDADREARQRKLNDTQARIAQLEKTIGEVNELNKRKKEVEEKLAVLDNLRKQRGGPVKLLDALSTAIPKKVWVLDFDEKGGGVKIQGAAESFEDVSEFMRGLNNIVWTPKGMGRVVEVRRDASARVELLTGDSAIEDFGANDVAHFFTNVEIKTAAAEATSSNPAKPNARVVKFEMALNVNYAI